MTQRRWPLVLALTAALLAAVAVGWAIGRATSSTTTTSTASTTSGAVQIINGIPVGVAHTRAGALAAADNYVATSSQTVISNPTAYNAFVRTVYVPSAVAAAIRAGAQVRQRSPQAVANYAAGGRDLSIIGARRLEFYGGQRANVSTWGGGFVWGPQKVPTQRWFLVRTQLVWDGQRWRVAALNQINRAAPAPASVVVSAPGADQVGTFNRELAGAQAPIYGAG